MQVGENLRELIGLRPLVGEVLAVNVETSERCAGLAEGGESAVAKGGTVLVEIEDRDGDLATSDQAWVLGLQMDEGVSGVGCRAACDVDETDGAVWGRCSDGCKVVCEHARHVLKAKPHGEGRERGGDALVDFIGVWAEIVWA